MKTKTTKTILSAAAAAALAFTATAQAAEKLNIYCWSEYIPQDVIDDFAKETGIKVSVENYASNEEMLAKLGAGGGSFSADLPPAAVLPSPALPACEAPDSPFTRSGISAGPAPVPS